MNDFCSLFRKSEDHFLPTVNGPSEKVKSFRVSVYKVLYTRKIRHFSLFQISRSCVIRKIRKMPFTFFMKIIISARRPIFAQTSFTTITKIILKVRPFLHSADTRLFVNSCQNERRPESPGLQRIARGPKNCRRCVLIVRARCLFFRAQPKTRCRVAKMHDFRFDPFAVL